jgi:uncharacterized coiled-coil protein SlyX
MYQKIVEDKKGDSKKKINEYNVWKSQKEHVKTLSTDLSTEQEKTKQQEEVISAQSDTIVTQKMTISQMTLEMAKLKKEIQRFNKLNSKLRDEKANLQTILDANQEIVRRMKSLFSRNSELINNTPSELKADLENTECELGEILKQNFLLTIDRLKKDAPMLDSLRKFYVDNKRYPEQIEKYIADGESLANKFAISPIPCVSKNSSEILLAINEMKMLLENKECGFGCKLAKFIQENILIVVLVSLGLLGLLIFLGLRKKKPMIKP